jgi:hypothetical protein
MNPDRSLDLSGKLAKLAPAPLQEVLEVLLVLKKKYLASMFCCTLHSKSALPPELSEIP